MWIQLFPARLREEWFVRVEGFDLQIPVVGSAVAAHEVDALAESARLGHQALVGDEAAIYLVLQASAEVRVGRIGHDSGRHIADPGIALLSAHKFVGGIALVISRPAVFPIMLVVGDDMRVHAILVQQLWHRVVKRLQRTPTAMQKVVAPGVQLAAGGHTRHAADEGVVEGRGAL